ncbi:cobalt ECF transporter T component CbiQ [Luxibacter massiliensis]|uniref:cobalt ECF transporter T component CbiQ n=1 Tax=Luxibacter massiliensis TaxID=2219695 RepID=UPI000F04CCFD|nr:cobalt ECF transporter T component CbiQ [Luxibacter massiliensis]
MIVVDKLCYRSKLRYINAGEKFAFSMATLMICIASRSAIIAVIVLLLDAYLTVARGGIPFRKYIRLMSVPFVFLILSTLAIIVNISKIPLDAYAVPVGTFFITGSRASLMFGVQLILTAMASVSCLYFLSLNTTMTDIVYVLKKLYCPGLLIELMLLVYRFIFVLMETASAIMVSQKSRLGNLNFKTSVSSFGQMGAGLFIRAFRRSNALYDAMESRCYDGRIEVLNEQRPARAKEIAMIAVFELLLLAFTIGRGLI